MGSGYAGDFVLTGDSVFNFRLREFAADTKKCQLES